jgi:hypothetical protein
MLILEIAAGIVLAVVILACWRAALALGAVALVVIAVGLLVLAVVAIGWEGVAGVALCGGVIWFLLHFVDGPRLQKQTELEMAARESEYAASRREAEIKAKAIAATRAAIIRITRRRNEPIKGLRRAR